MMSKQKSMLNQYFFLALSIIIAQESILLAETKFINPAIALPSIGYINSENFAYAAVGDFNGDGIVDVVAPMGYMSAIYKLDALAEVFLSNGPRKYTKTKLILPNARFLEEKSVVVGDFNGDGIDDFAIYCAAFQSNLSGAYKSETYQLLPYITQRTASGTIFVKGTPIPLFPGAHDVKVVDLNGDGLPDITALIGASHTSSVDGQITVINTGGGRFSRTTMKTHAPHFTSFYQLIADFNFDGFLDSIVPGFYRDSSNLSFKAVLS